MFHIGIDDDHIIFLNRDQPVFHQEFSQAADDIEQLGKMMGMGKTLPVASYLEVEAYRRWKSVFGVFQDFYQNSIVRYS